MDDIRILCTFPRHRKTVRLRLALGSDGVLALINLWCYARETSPETGMLTDHTIPEIEMAAGWRGGEGILVDVLVGIGWLDVGDDKVIGIHDWSEHQPWAVGASERSEAARTGAEARWGKREKKKKNSSKSNGLDVEDAIRELPSNLVSIGEIVREWFEFRRTDLRRPITRVAWNRQVKQLEGWGSAVARESIDASIRSQWRGLFSPEDRLAKSSKVPAYQRSKPKSSEGQTLRRDQ